VEAHTRSVNALTQVMKRMVSTSASTSAESPCRIEWATCIMSCAVERRHEFHACAADTRVVPQALTNWPRNCTRLAR